MILRSVVLACLVAIPLCGCVSAQVDQAASVANAEASNEIKDIRFKLTTTRGDIEGVLFATKTPMTVANFCNLAKRKYYDGIVFHRVIPNFMAQVGDPLTKQPGKEPFWGTGGPGYKFADEFRNDLRHNRPGVLSMANSGPRTNGSQIFITHVPTPHLDGKHTVFGHVTKGQEIVDTTQKGDKIKSITLIDNPAPLFAAQAANIKKWNAVLDRQEKNSGQR